MRGSVRNPRVSRRALLSSLGVSAALSPFLPLLNAHGQEAQPQRLILWFTPHGTIYDNWKPTGGETDFTLQPDLEAARGAPRQAEHFGRLESQRRWRGRAAHQRSAALVDGVAAEQRHDVHARRRLGRHVLRLEQRSPVSTKLILSGKLNVTTPYKSLEFGVRSGSSFLRHAHDLHRLWWRCSRPRPNPWAAFKRLIGDIGKTTDHNSSNSRAERRSVLDVLSGELTALADARSAAPTSRRSTRT